MNHDTMKEAAELLQQARRENDRPDQTACAQRNVLRIVIRVLVIVLGELAVVGCSGGVFRSSNYNDAGEQWSSDAAISDPTSDAQATGGNVGTISTESAGSGGSTSFGTASLSSGGYSVATGGNTFDATGGATQYQDPGACPCPFNTACQVSSSGCNVPGTKGNEGNETFTCVVSPLHCATAARPVFCFQC